MFSSQVEEMNTARGQARVDLSQLKQVSEFVADYRDPQGRRFDDAGIIDGQVYSLREAIAHAEGGAQMFLAINLDKNKPLPNALWQQIRQALQELHAATVDLAAQMTTAKTDGQVLTVANGSAITARDTGATVANFTAGATRAVAAADILALQSTLLIALGKASLLAKNDKEGTVIADDAKASAAALTKAEQSAQQALDAAKQAQAALTALEASRVSDQSRFDTTIAKMEADAVDAQKVVEQIRAAAATASEQVAVATARVSDASLAKSQAEDSNKAIAAYNSTLEATKQRVASVEASAQATIAEVQAQSDDVKKLIQDAEAMLRGATVSGLATAFADERKSLDKALVWAIIWFGAGIVLLTATTATLSAYVLNIPFYIKGIDITHLNSDARHFEPTVVGVISRAIILLGPFWLTLFSARRYARLFDLRQRYSHKYNMAMSVEGFKKQAPAYAEAISAWVFQIVAENPVQQKSGGPMDEAPSLSFKDIGSSLMEHVGKVFGGGA